MPTCPHCGNFVSQRAVACRHCKALLVDPHALLATQHTDTPDSTVRVLQFPEDRIANKDRRPALDDTKTTSAVNGRLDLLEPLHPNEIALLIEGEAVPLVIAVSGSVVVGRYSAHAVEQPHVDLVPYGAFEKGVSRYHAQVNRTGDTFTIEDLASSNGTWVNGKRLLAREPHEMGNGDYLCFGHLRLQVHFKAQTEAEHSSTT
jgi:FHA domain